MWIKPDLQIFRLARPIELQFGESRISTNKANDNTEHVLERRGWLGIISAYTFQNTFSRPEEP